MKYTHGYSGREKFKDVLNRMQAEHKMYVKRLRSIYGTFLSELHNENYLYFSIVNVNLI